ncbi:unnamed protein product [Candidula unifasciata]|uniref:Hexosyltransferase n=1 Tax=Candidula unifasciata TaxID=100452 RepID=A0A8S3YGX5_9EUPU|nr:unnamed protein product [Candidula unifasciata]
MARYKNMCTYLRRTLCLRRVLISSALTLSSCALVLFWSQSYRGFGLWSDTRNQGQTTADYFTAAELLSQQEQQLSSEDELIRVVDKLDQQEHQLSSQNELIRTVDKLDQQQEHQLTSQDKLIRVVGKLDQQEHQLSSQDELIRAVDKLDQQQEHQLSSQDELIRAVDKLDQQQEHQLSSQDKLIRAVDKLPFRTMTPSLLLLEDLYFNPSLQQLVEYNNPVLHQPQINCSQSTLLILVPSHPRSVAERRAIRETWGSVARGRHWPGKGDNFGVILVFVLGVAEAQEFQPENIQRAKSVLRQDVDALRSNTDSYFTESTDRTFFDRTSNTSSILMKKDSIINLVYEKAGDANKETLDNMAYVLGMKTVHNNRLRHSLKMWRNHFITEQSSQAKKPTMEGGINALLLRSDKSIHKTSTTPHMPTTPYSHNDANLLEEIFSFGDILQFDMIDTYANLTRKMIISLQLLLKTCSGVKFILKVDPDIFVNVPLLATFLGRHGDKNSVYGRIYPNSAVERTGKWAVAKSALPISRYPIYAAGNAYVMSADAAEKIVGLASRFPYILVEDAFITGILASVGRINRVNVAGFTKWTEPKPDACDFVTDKIYVGNNFTEYDHRLYWREIIDRGGYRCDV